MDQQIVKVVTVEISGWVQTNGSEVSTMARKGDGVLCQFLWAEARLGLPIQTQHHTIATHRTIFHRCIRRDNQINHAIRIAIARGFLNQ